jgi:hypothetical protein
MPVLVTAAVKGQTREGYDAILTYLGDSLKSAPGFIMHYSHPSDDGWIVSEIWETKADSDAWFAKNVVPNLPQGIHPKRNYQELHNVITP